jgi:hypothetical protein
MLPPLRDSMPFETISLPRVSCFVPLVQRQSALVYGKSSEAELLLSRIVEVAEPAVGFKGMFQS